MYFLPSAKFGNSVLIYKSNKFWMNNRLKNTLSWACSYRKRLNCTCRVVTSLSGKFVFLQDVEYYLGEEFLNDESEDEESLLKEEEDWETYQKESISKRFRKIIKKAKVKGAAHVNHGGKVVPAKNDPSFMSMDCCHRQCLKRIHPPELLKKVLISFYKHYETKDQQDRYLQTMIKTGQVRRRRPKIDPATKRTYFKRTYSTNYYLSIKRKRIRVCLKAFGNAHNIGKGRIRRIAALQAQGIQPTDLRGKRPYNGPRKRKATSHMEDILLSSNEVVYDVIDPDTLILNS